MIKETVFEIDSFSPVETEKIGFNLGSLLKGGEILNLCSDLGGGKTTLARGIAGGTNSKDHVSSPTFKICNVYASPGIDIYHYDFYRLENPGLIQYELHDVLGDPRAVLVIEWGAIADNVITRPKMDIEIKKTATGRKLILNIPNHYQHIISELSLIYQ